MNRQPTVMIVSSEFWPLAKTGGLGDMVYAIATSLRNNGFEVRVLMPGYRSALSTTAGAGEHKGTISALGYDVELVAHRYSGIEVVLACCASLFDRPGGLYNDESGRGWADNAKRFGALCYAAAAIVNGTTTIPVPHIVHLLDWHAALTPAYVDPGTNVPFVLTVQNFMFQGRFPMSVVSDLEMERRPDIHQLAGIFSGFGFLQVGLRLSDMITTASAGYIDDIKRRDRYSWYYLREPDLDRLVPIKNWVETAVWDPANDQALEARYNADDLGKRSINRAALERRVGWPESSDPILFTLSRITRAKGFRFLFRQIDRLVARGCRVIIVGEGESRLVNAAKSLAQKHHGRVAVMTPYEERDARLVLGGGDILLMPSLTEPCGLSQQHAQIYGCVPIVSNVGGLRDTVTHGQTGFLFEPSDQTSFLAAVDAACDAMRGPGWLDIQKNAMRLHAANSDGDKYAQLFFTCIDNYASREAVSLAVSS
ncbi:MULTISPECIES: glycogen synthase [unclassified Sphingomonas]|uniref:glycogen synthase n=1 Tax=unclassified Sphingomonas TaxID=196159 RepID=UPI0009E97B15|nr:MULTISPECIES: glycogen/starch synthase [unclassified Sphingomonas]